MKRDRRRAKPCGKRKLKMRGAPSRNCGECEACCWALGVDEIQLANFVHCEHQRSINPEAPGPADYGCRAYGERPRLCRRYRCEWLAGMMFHGIPPESLRPDKCGVIFHGMKGTVWGMILIATEAFPDGFQHPMAQYLLDAIQKQRLVLLVGPTGRKLTGPRKRMEIAQQQAAAAIRAGQAKQEEISP